MLRLERDQSVWGMFDVLQVWMKQGMVLALRSASPESLLQSRYSLTHRRDVLVKLLRLSQHKHPNETLYHLSELQRQMCVTLSPYPVP